MRSKSLLFAVFLLGVGALGSLQAYPPIYTPKKTITPADLVSGVYNPLPMTVTGMTSSGGVAGYLTFVRKQNSLSTTYTQGFYWDDAAQHLLNFDSPMLGWSSGSMVTCVNAVGGVAGIYWSSSLSGQQSGFLYQNGSLSFFQSPTGADIDAVVAVNAGGQVIGTYFGVPGLKRAFLWNGTTSVDLGDLGDPDHSFIWPQAINDAGQVVGTIFTPSEEIGGLAPTAFQWSGGTFSTVTGTEDYSRSGAVSINSLGEIAGTYAVPSLTQAHTFKNGGFYWSNDALTDLGDLGGGSTAPFFISDDGVVTGTAYGRGNLLRLFSWQAGVLGDLGPANLDTSDQSFEMTGVNRLGDVTGFVTNASGVDQAFLRTLGSNYNLAALVPGSFGFAADRSNGSLALINDDEVIAASGFSHGVPVVVLMTPDADGNGLPDGWEQYYFGHYPVDPTAPLAWNANLTIRQAYQLGINPTDFYNGQAPVFVSQSGQNQHGAPDEFVRLPLTISVTSNGQPAINAPVTFTVSRGNGQVQRSSNSTPTASLTVLTDYDGVAKVYFQLSPQANARNEVTARPGCGNYPLVVKLYPETADLPVGINGSPFNPSNVVATMNRDGSADVTWTNNADPTDNEPIDIRYRDRNGVWQVLTSVDGQATSYHIPAP